MVLQGCWAANSLVMDSRDLAIKEKATDFDEDRQSGNAS